jgi:branched-subunit amino acid aminotransferase/4-amino-4-deoxychorismate lyase
MQAAFELHALTASGAQRLPLPEGLGDPEAVYDDLPLGVYEGLRTYDGVRFFGLAEHLGRARRSHAARDLAPLLDERALRRGLHDAVCAFAGDARVRIDHLARPAVSLGTDATTLVGLRTLVPVPDEILTNGAGVRLLRDLVRRDPAIKDAEFATRRRLHAWDQRDNYEPVLVDREGRLLEGIMSNFCAVLDGELRTAPAGVLPGVTLRFVLALARERGARVREEAVHENDVGRLEEAFFTTSVRSVVPIARIDGRAVGAGRPGALTRALRADYVALAEREARPAIDG